MKSILLEIFKDVSFTESELDLMSEKMTKVRLNRRAFLLKAEEEVHDIHYIHEGCLRSYFIDASGKEHTLQFAIKGWWISDYIALFGKGKNKSVSYIECIKDATLYKVSKKDFDGLCKKNP